MLRIFLILDLYLVYLIHGMFVIPETSVAPRMANITYDTIKKMPEKVYWKEHSKKKHK